jgi:hypothetical protein
LPSEYFFIIIHKKIENTKCLYIPLYILYAKTVAVYTVMFTLSKSHSLSDSECTTWGSTSCLTDDLSNRYILTLPEQKIANRDMENLNNYVKDVARHPKAIYAGKIGKFRYKIMRLSTGVWSVFVKIYRKHKLCSASIKDLNAVLSVKRITYARREEGKWWIGFEYSTETDYIPNCDQDIREHDNKHGRLYRSYEDVELDMELVIEELAELAKV